MTGGREADITGGGEVHAAGGSVEEVDTDLTLEVVDLSRERGLCDAKAPGGGNERRLLGDRDEVPEVPEFHESGDRALCVVLLRDIEQHIEDEQDRRP